ncbi:MAG: phosphatidate cytidylyltransferase [Chthonomonas sp.]|nr:phosphatidate cytidylyltransferase [Chthonomonas sp.]
MKTRVLTAILLIGIALGAIFAPWKWPLLGLGFVLVGIGGHELSKLLRSGAIVTVLAALAYAGFALGSDWSIGKGPYLALLAATLMLGFIGCLKKPLHSLSGLYLAAPLAACVWLQQLGPLMLLLALVPVWAGDTAAIFAGRAWGKTKLMPTISPNKTWEGSAAHAVSAMAAGALLSTHNLGLGIAAGAICTVFGQAGDLFESYMKRRAGVKDSGTLLPGHGGVLDRIDAMLLTAVPVALLIYCWPAR